MKNSILFRVLTTSQDGLLAFLRIVLSIIMFAHGAQKMLGWFGGHGPVWTVEMWEKWFGFSPAITWLVIIGEFVAPILLLIGFLSRIMASILVLIILGAVYIVHLNWGFYMNWYNEQNRGEGFEYHILIIAVGICIMIRGGGKWSIDGRLTQS